jgi:hypothetical protein
MWTHANEPANKPQVVRALFHAANEKFVVCVGEPRSVGAQLKQLSSCQLMN